MKYIKYTLYTPYGGTDEEGYARFHDDDSIEYIEATLQSFALTNGESYEYLVTGWDDDMFEDEEEREAALESYYEDCGFDYHLISKEEYCECH